MFRKADSGVIIVAVNGTMVMIPHCNQFRMTLVQDSLFTMALQRLVEYSGNIHSG